LIPVVALAADADKGQAIEAAKSWVGLVDAGGYAQSWKSASPLFQSHVTEAQWAAAAKATRDPLGPVVTRNVAGADFAATLPGAPDGQYAVVTFDTKFANKAAAVETVALARDRGSWKAAGYYVR
jgi:hypothetical protein